MLLAEECIEMGCPLWGALITTHQYKGAGDRLRSSSVLEECESCNCILWVTKSCRWVCTGEAVQSPVPVMGERLLAHNCAQPKWVPCCPLVKDDAALDMSRDAGLSDWEISKWRKRPFLG